MSSHNYQAFGNHTARLVGLFFFQFTEFLNCIHPGISGENLHLILKRGNQVDFLFGTINMTEKYQTASQNLIKLIQIFSLRHSVNGDFSGHSRFVLWHENLTTFVS